MMKQRHLLVAVLVASFALLDIVLADTAPEGKSDVDAPAPAAAVKISQQPSAKDGKKTPTVGLIGPEWTWPKNQKQGPTVGLVGPEWTWPKHQKQVPAVGLVGPEWTWPKNQKQGPTVGLVGPEWTWPKHQKQVPAVGLVGPEWTWPKHQKQVPAVGLVGPEWTWSKNKGQIPGFGAVAPEWRNWPKHKEDEQVQAVGLAAPEWTWAKHSDEGGLPPILRGGGRGKNYRAGLGRSLFNGGIVPPANLPPGIGTGSLRPRLGAPSIPRIIGSGRKHKKPCWRNKRKCVGKPVTGPCRAAMPMFHYDKASNTCRQFTYGGCGGNNNRWIHQKNCESVCVNRKKPSRCRNKYGEIVLVKPKHCPVRKCTRHCRYGYQRDKNGCRTCYCLKRQNKPTIPHQQNKPAEKHLAIDFLY